LSHIFYTLKPTKKTYVGYSSSIIRRFYSHNVLANKGYSIKFRPWVVLETDFHSSKKDAMKREKFLKSGDGRKYLKDTVIPKYVEMDSYAPEADGNSSLLLVTLLFIEIEVSTCTIINLTAIAQVGCY
jgi:putative endonuclease